MAEILVFFIGTEWKAIVFAKHYGSGAGNRGCVVIFDNEANEIFNLQDYPGGNYGGTDYRDFNYGTANIKIKMPYGGNTYIKFLLDGDLYKIPYSNSDIIIPTFIQTITAGFIAQEGIGGFPTSSGYGSYYLGLK